MFVFNESQIKIFKCFNKLAQLRIYSIAISTLFISMITPVLFNIKGNLLTPDIIGMFLIASTLIVKTNRVIVENVTPLKLYEYSIYFQILFIIGLVSYFLDKVFFVYLESTIFVIEVGLFSSLTIVITDMIVKEMPELISDFNIYKNSLIADFTLLGLSISVLFSYFNKEDTIVFITISFVSLYTIWLIKNKKVFMEMLNI